MAELTTIARPYAEAAFRIASDANALPVWSEMLRFLCDVTAEPRAAAALDNPKLTAADKAALLLSIGGERLDAIGPQFRPRAGRRRSHRACCRRSGRCSRR